MLTIFSVPKTFRDKINIIQRNAILSWKKLQPECEIILFGDEEGVKRVSQEIGVKNIPEIEKNELGTPLVGSAFNLAKKIAKNNLLVYADCDTILMNDLIKASQMVKEPQFLMASQRWNLEINELINFNEADWERRLLEKAIREGESSSPAAMDYFLFPRNLKIDFPPFIIGRQGWDDWFIYKLRELKIPIIDATSLVMAIHQKHDHPFYSKENQYNKENKANINLLGGFHHAFTLREADLILTKNGLIKNKYLFSPFRAFYRYFVSFLNTYPYFSFWKKIILFPFWLPITILGKIRRFFLNILVK